MRCAGVVLGLACVMACVSACREERYFDERVMPPRAGEQIPIQTSGISAGGARRPPAVANPFEDNVQAIRDGQRFYSWFNCAGCHGAIGGGGMGPPLRDQDWIYGGDPAQIYHSIVQGRPQGMPAYRGLPDDTVWKLVTYVRSLGPQGSTGVVISEPERSQEQPRQERRDVRP